MDVRQSRAATATTSNTSGGRRHLKGVWHTMTAPTAIRGASGTKTTTTSVHHWALTAFTTGPKGQAGCCAGYASRPRGLNTTTKTTANGATRRRPTGKMATHHYGGLGILTATAAALNATTTIAERTAAGAATDNLATQNNQITVAYNAPTTRKLPATVCSIKAATTHQMTTTSD